MPMTPQPERVAQYQNLRNISTDFKASSSQARRRQDALARQKDERRAAFSLHRDGLDDILEDLALSESSGSDDEQGNTTSKVNPREDDNDRFGDAEESQSELGVGEDQNEEVLHPSRESGVASSKYAKSQTRMPRRIKKKTYANRLMQGEMLDLDNEGLPADLAGEWLALGPVPKGKRCMAVTFTKTRRYRSDRTTNTILLARTTGRPIARQYIPALPPNCVLDCVYVSESATLFIMDVLQWKGQSVAEGEAEFRMFWRDSMLAELPVQAEPQWHAYAKEVSAATGAGDAMAEDPKAEASDTEKKSSSTGRFSHLLVVPIPCIPASTEFPQLLLNELVRPCQLNQTGEIDVTVTSNPQDHPSRQLTMPHKIQYQISGISLLVKSAAYESGSSPLAAWVPKSQMEHFATLLSSCL